MEHLLNQNELTKVKDHIVQLPWFGFDHDRKQTYPPAPSLDGYAGTRGWSDRQLDSLRTCPYLFGMTGLAMLQSMLFFGIWESVTDAQVHLKDFIQSSSTSPMLCTTALRGFIQQLSTLLCSTDDSPSKIATVKAKSNRLTKIMDEVMVWDGILLVPCSTEFSQAISTLRRQTALAIDLLTLFHHQIPSPLRGKISGFHHLNRNKGFYIERIRMNGVCPSYYEYLDFVGLSTLEYFSVVCPYIGSNDSDHRACTNSICVGNSVTAAPVGRANHIKEDCNCRLVNLPISGIRDILETDNYFVIDIDRLLDRTLSPIDAITPYAPGVQYVAFSHVWSHGLGNIADRGLPVCRLRRLKKLISSLVPHYGPMKHFWIDAMCIPKDRELKVKSIGMMDKIYRNSRVVMALDKMLQNMSLETLSHESLALCILLSDWNRRLWTFQEARLGMNLAIGLRNCWISAQKLCDALFDNASRGIASPVTLDCAHQLSCLTQNTTGLFEWMPLLQFRSCSVATDEALVIGALTGLSTQSLAEDDGDLRMAKLWVMLGEVPAGLLFHVSPKLAVDNYRWAPRSLLCGSTETGVGGARYLDAKVTMRGLLASYYVLELKETLCFSAGLQQQGHIVIEMQGLQLMCFKRKYDDEKEQTMVGFNAIALARDPHVHRDRLPNTPLSAAALLQKRSTMTGIPSYIHQFQLLINLESVMMDKSDVRAAKEQTVLIS